MNQCYFKYSEPTFLKTQLFSFRFLSIREVGQSQFCEIFEPLLNQLNVLCTCYVSKKLKVQLLEIDIRIKVEKILTFGSKHGSNGKISYIHFPIAISDFLLSIRARLALVICAIIPAMVYVLGLSVLVTFERLTKGFIEFDLCMSEI